MKASLIVFVCLIGGSIAANAEMSLTGGAQSPPMSSQASPNSQLSSQAAPTSQLSSQAMPNSSVTTSPSVPMTTTSIPQAGTSAGSPQTAGPLNAPPNGAGGTFGYPNSAIDPNTTNPGLPQPNYYSAPIYNNGSGTMSGTTTSVTPSSAPFVTPPAMANPNVVLPAGSR